MSEPPDLPRYIAERLDGLSPALRRVGEHVLADPSAPQRLTITELARAVGVADSTITRFATGLGLDGYYGLRVGMAEAASARRALDEAGGHGGAVYDDVQAGDDPAAVVAKLARSARDAVGATSVMLDTDALAAAVALVEATSMLAFASIGSSSLAADCAVGRFTRAGRACLFERDQARQLMSATVAGPDALVVGISDSGRTTAVVEALRLAAGHGARTLAITSGASSPLCEHAEVVLLTAPGSPDGIDGEAVTAKWGQLLAVDALYAAYAARHVDATLEHLRKSFATAIEGSRS